MTDNGSGPEAALSERDRELLRMYEDCGASPAAVGRALGITRQRAKVLLDRAHDELNVAPEYLSADPKLVLPIKLRRALIRHELTAAEAVKQEAWTWAKGIGGASRQLLCQHYGD